MQTLKDIRTSSKMSRAKLAQKFDVSEKTIYTWEKGEPIKAHVIYAYAGLFGVPVEEIDALTEGYSYGVTQLPDPAQPTLFDEEPALLQGSPEGVVTGRAIIDLQAA